MVDRVAQRACVSPSSAGGTGGEYISAGAFPGTESQTSVLAFVRQPGDQNALFGVAAPRLVRYGNNWGFYEDAPTRNFRVRYSGALLNIYDTFNPALLERLLIVAATYDGADERRYINGVPAGSSNLGSIALGTDQFRISQPSQPARLFHIPAYIHSTTTVLDDAEIADFYAAVKADLEQGREVRTFNGQTHYFDARDVVIGGGGTRATWTDRLAGLTLTKSGVMAASCYPMRAP